MERKRIFLVYQGGLANVFEVDCHNIGLTGRNAKRLLQHAFMPCVYFARGLAAGGAIVHTAYCNEAGDITDRPWREDFDNAPFHDKFVILKENTVGV